jgi:glycosyltransferase involved in cell wall biosynthesis
VPEVHDTNGSTKELTGCNPIILLGNLSAGGSERQGYLLAKGLVGAGLQPGVIAWSLTRDDVYGRLLLESGIRLAIAPQEGRLAKLRWLRRVAREVRPPLLHSYAFFLNAAAAWAMRGVDGVAIGAIRADYRYEACNGRFHYALNRFWPKAIIANSANARDAAMADRSLLSPRHVHFVQNGLALESYVQRKHSPHSHPRVLGVGNLHELKRWDRLIRATSSLRTQDPQLDFTVDIVGEGIERQNLLALIADLKLADRVRLLGRRYDVPELLAASDVFALVSESEGSPNAVMEAMAAGVPVLATEVGDVPRLVTHGLHGYVVPPSDEEALTQRLRALIADHDLRARMGAAAHAKAHEEFGLDRLVEGTLSAYRNAGWRS